MKKSLRQKLHDVVRAHCGADGMIDGVEVAEACAVIIAAYVGAIGDPEAREWLMKKTMREIYLNTQSGPHAFQ